MDKLLTNSDVKNQCWEVYEALKKRQEWLTNTPLPSDVFNREMRSVLRKKEYWENQIKNTHCGELCSLFSFLGYVAPTFDKQHN